METNPHVGGTFDEVLQGEGLLAEVDAAGRAKVQAWEYASRHFDLTYNEVAFEATHEKVGGDGAEVERVVRHYLSHPDIRPLFGRQRRIWYAYLRASGLVNDTDRDSLTARLNRASGHVGEADGFFNRRLTNAEVALRENELEYADFLLKMIGY